MKHDMTPPDHFSQFQGLNKKEISGRNCSVCMRCCSISTTTTVTPHLSRNSSKQYTLNTPSLPPPHSSLLRYNPGRAFLSLILSHLLVSLTQKKVLEKTIPCPSCDIKFATNMSLKMHLNLQHPVKAEVSQQTYFIMSLYCSQATDTEHLLTEEKDDAEERDEKIRDEMNSMGTSEMLDDLVSFLNEL